MYTKHTWVHEEIITRQNLNHMEQGIYDNAQAIAAYVAPAVLTQTLTAGNTSLTFTDASISEATSINLLTAGGIAPISQTVSGSTYTVTFEAQSADMDVRIEVK